MDTIKDLKSDMEGWLHRHMEGSRSVDKAKTLIFEYIKTMKPFYKAVPYYATTNFSEDVDHVLRYYYTVYLGETAVRIFIANRKIKGGATLESINKFHRTWKDNYRRLEAVYTDKDIVIYTFSTERDMVDKTDLDAELDVTFT